VWAKRANKGEGGGGLVAGLAEEGGRYRTGSQKPNKKKEYFVLPREREEALPRGGSTLEKKGGIKKNWGVYLSTVE